MSGRRKRSHNAAVACFHYASPAFPVENFSVLIHSVFSQAPFDVCVFVITWLIPTCLCDTTGVHTSIKQEKIISCKLVKRKRDSHYFPLWPDF